MKNIALAMKPIPFLRHLANYMIGAPVISLILDDKTAGEIVEGMHAKYKRSGESIHSALDDLERDMAKARELPAPAEGVHTIDHLIASLTAIRDAHGNLPLGIWDDGNDGYYPFRADFEIKTLLITRGSGLREQSSADEAVPHLIIAP